MDANEQKARELRDRYCPAGNYEHSDVLDAIMAALDMKPALSKPKVQTEHLWCTNCEGVHPESCFNATPSAQQVPADGEVRVFNCRRCPVSVTSRWIEPECPECGDPCELDATAKAATPQAPQPELPKSVAIGSKSVDGDAGRALEWVPAMKHVTPFSFPNMSSNFTTDASYANGWNDCRKATIAAYGKGGESV